MAYYNHLHDKIRQEESLPEDMQWQEMQAGIFQKMKTKKKRRPLFIWIWGIAAFLFISGSVGLYSYRKTTTNAPQAERNQTQLPQSSKLPIPSQTAQTPLSNIQNPSFQNADIKTISHAKTPNHAFKSSNKTTSDRIIIENTAIKSTEVKDILNTPTAKKIQEKTTDIIVGETSKKMIDDSTVLKSMFIAIHQKSSEIQKSQPVDVGNTQTPIIQDPFFVQPLPSSVRYVSTPPKVMEIKQDQKIWVANQPKKLNRFLTLKSISVHSGLHFNNLHHQYFSPSSNEVRASYTEKGLPGFDIQAIAHFHWNRKWSLSSGLIYNGMYSVVDYKGKSQVGVTLKNVVVRVENNLLSGNQSSVIGDTTLLSDSNRAFRHRNEMHNISIPVLIGYQKTSGKWQYHTSVGALFSVYGYHRGKTFYNDRVVIFDGERPTYHNNLGIGFTTQLGLRYLFHPRWSIGSQIGWQHFLGNWSSDPSLVVTKPSLWNAQWTLMYHL